MDRANIFSIKDTRDLNSYLIASNIRGVIAISEIILLYTGPSVHVVFCTTKRFDICHRQDIVPISIFLANGSICMFPKRVQREM